MWYGQEHISVSLCLDFDNFWVLILTVTWILILEDEHANHPLQIVPVLIAAANPMNSF